MKKIPKDLLKQYNATRDPFQTHIFCHAPFRSLFFSLNGNVYTCCANKKFVVGKYPKRSPREIWFGRKINRLRKKLISNNLSLGCNSCAENIKMGNFNIMASKIYDNVPTNEIYPSRLDFNLSNICNLECIMCNGGDSSAIFKKQKALTTLQTKQYNLNLYGKKFVEEIREFIPHLKTAFFIGGEPFLIKVFYDLWEIFTEVNNECELVIQTNGTILSNKIKMLLEKGRFYFNVSLDSLDKKTFEMIRVNANFEKTMSNLEYFIEYAERKNTYTNLTVCPVQQNWKEIPHLVNFANEKKISIYFNTVFKPGFCSFSGFNNKQRNEVIDYYSSFNFPEKTNWERINKASFKTLINQLRNFY
ncbi:MAG: radical SAM protein [Bacteroidales bacterium]|jgi:MoaA/NifB/PqqE/SkfB family radical SAM enzyme|nr:radical SAM protein [Bacteroidales bacterium]